MHVLHLSKQFEVVAMKKKNMTYPFQYCFLVITPFHEQNNFPTRVAVDGINLHGKKLEDVSR